MNNLVPINPEYIYITIPAEYICVYHRILVMLSDFGEEMLKDCKASCTNRNTDIINCFNMFNAAVAARKLGRSKLAETLIKYIKAKINQIYKSVDNSKDFIFPIDENGELTAFVSCGEIPHFFIDENDMNLYEHKFGNGFNEHFGFGEEDEFTEKEEGILEVSIYPEFHPNPCAEVIVKFNDEPIDINNVVHTYYFDDIAVRSFRDIGDVSEGNHTFMVVVTYKGNTKIAKQDINYEIS